MLPASILLVVLIRIKKILLYCNRFLLPIETTTLIMLRCILVTQNLHILLDVLLLPIIIPLVFVYGHSSSVFAAEHIATEKATINISHHRHHRSFIVYTDSKSSLDALQARSRKKPYTCQCWISLMN